jgi:hypothetical protein
MNNKFYFLIFKHDDLFEKKYLPNQSIEEIDRRKIGDTSFISLYNLFKKLLKTTITKN